MPPKTGIRKKNITLVLGGAQSGKSHYARQLACQFGRVTFIATGRETDAEMREKIARHRRERPASWKTIEAPAHLDRAIRRESQNADVLLIDCLTLYADNVAGTGRKRKTYAQNCVEELCGAIRASEASVIAVSNEVGSGIVPEYRSGRIYRDLLGRMNQKIAQIADRVILMVAGVPVTIKDSAASAPVNDLTLARGEAEQATASANGAHKNHYRSKEEVR